MRSYGIRVGPASNEWCLYKRKERAVCARRPAHGHMGRRPREDGGVHAAEMKPQAQEHPGMAGSTPKPGRGMNQDPPRTFGKGMALPAP